VSDFLVPGCWENPLRALASRQDVVAIEVIDPRELDLPDVGPLAVADPETGRRRIIDTGDATLRVRYADAAQAGRADVAHRIAAAGALLLVPPTAGACAAAHALSLRGPRPIRGNAAAAAHGSRR
jgi:hypothetical protein